MYKIQDISQEKSTKENYFYKLKIYQIIIIYNFRFKSRNGSHLKACSVTTYTMTLQLQYTILR